MEATNTSSYQVTDTHTRQDLKQKKPVSEQNTPLMA
jgi:hypothetical protein